MSRLVKVPSFFKNPKYPKTLLIVLTAATIGFLVFNFAKSGKVLGINNEDSSSPLPLSESPIPTTLPSSIPSSSPKQIKTTPKTEYSLAVYGDSMVDTMGENLEYLDKALKAQYPLTKFKLYNYGIGSQNIEEGLARFDQAFTYKERKFPPISELKPDILIVGSFAYNPFPVHNKSKHYDLLNQLVKKADGVSPDIYLLCEIAPLGDGFGVGKNGVNWPPEIAKPHAAKIVEQLLNAHTIAKAGGYKLIDAYSETKTIGEFGSPAYTDGNDGIHPSVRGHVIMGNLIARSLVFK